MINISDIRPVLEAAAQFALTSGTFSNLFFKGGRVMSTDCNSIFIGSAPGIPDCVLAVKDLMHFLRNVPSGAGVNLTETETAVKLAAGRYRATIQKIHAPNMPDTDHIFGTPFSHIQASPVIHQIQTTWPLITTLGALTHFSVPETDKEYVALHGVYTDENTAYAGNKFCVASFDTRTLADFAAVPSMRFPQKLTKFMLTLHECPAIFVKQDYIWTQYAAFSIITQRSAIQYPPAVIDTVTAFEPTYEFLLGGEEAQRKETLRRLNIAESATIPIHATVKGKELQLYTITPEKSKEAHDALPIMNDCEDLSFWFQSGFSFFSRALLNTTTLRIMRKSSQELILGMVQTNGITLYMKSRVVRGAQE